MTDQGLQGLLVLALQRQDEARATVQRALDSLQPMQWYPPVGTVDMPVPEWYSAQGHDTSSAAGHTGIDLNLDRANWGDIDRGQPGWAVTNGIVYAVGYSQSYLGGVVIEVEHEGQPLYIRYWHLADDPTFRRWCIGAMVGAGDCVGHIGNYTLGAGGDHLHFDMRDRLFEPHWWFTSHPGGWKDPVPVLKAHMAPALVDEMLRKKR